MLDCEQIHARNLRVPAAVPSRALSAVVSTSRKPKYPPPAPLPTVKTMTNSLLIAIVTDEVSDAALAIAEREGIRGATILPANPSFYSRPSTLTDLADTVVARVLDHLGIPHRLVARWQEEPE